MTEINKAVARRWFEEVWNQGAEHVIDELYAKDAITHGIGESEPDLHGPADFKPFVRNLRNSFPDLHMSIEDSVAEGDMVVVRVLMEGTHKGDGLGVPPTGRRVRVTGLVMARMVNGQMVEGWNNWDQLGLLRQIGALPGMEGPDRFVASRV